MLAHRLTYPVYVRPWLRRQFCAFAERLKDRKRKDLAKYITLVESTLPQHQQEAKKLMKVVLEKRKQSNINDSIRIGISGSPGVGKSTFIESFGLSLIERGHRVAVLAVDPSSTRGGGGSILGDKTRMTNLSLHENAYIRPSPSRGNLGGVARNTMESILLCEEFGYDIETVGVGQSEVEVEGIVDFYLLLVQPASGDELQGIKKGVVEVADLIVVTKADGDLAKRSSMTQYEYMNAIKFMTPKLSHWFPRVLKCSSTTGAGIPEIIDTVKEFRRCGTETGFIGQHRGEQLEDWMWRIIFEETKRSFLNDSSVIHSLPKTLEKVRSEEYFPWDSANYLLDIYFNHLKKKKGEELE